MRQFFGLFYLVLICSLVACQEEKVKPDPLAHIEQPELKAFLTKVMEATGGLENWNNIQSLSYNKSFNLYRADSTLERSAEQVHDYQYEPETSILILSREGKDVKRLALDGGKISETINDSINKDATQQVLNNKLQSALFVISQPFKLADPGVQLSLEGIDTLHNGNVVHVLKAVYDPSTQSHYTTPDTWWLYFDQDSYLMTGYKVEHLDHISLVDNLKTVKVEGFTFPVSRNSYRVNKAGEILYLRADYAYSNFKVNKNRSD